MSFLTQWITNIIIFILLAIVIDLLLPNSNLKRYTKMVTGLLLITIILSPLFQLFNQDFNQIMENMDLEEYVSAEEIKNQIDFKKKEIQASNRAYTLEHMAVQLEESVKEELMTQYGLEIKKINIQAQNLDELSNEPNIQSVFISLKENDVQESDTIPVVEIVEIDTEKPSDKQTSPSEDEKTIRTLLSEKWSLDPEVIEVDIERGNEG
ncbi:stage III sporulation protein AF [Bacillus carboniphilus]|uniref:Stage III sporulation protein AF n=1 Tax=Bacillus carboniphilus TaxID=86663 RepID=A0ABP3GL64_9BACI